MPIFWTLCGAAVKSLTLLAAAWTAALLLRRQSAALRHLVWTAAFASMVAMPFLSAGLPDLRIAWNFPAVPGAEVLFHDTATAVRDDVVLAGHEVARTADASRTATPHPNWPMLLGLVWGLGAASAGVRLLTAYRAVRRVRRHARAFDDGGLGVTLAHALGIGARVEVLEGPAGSMPMAVGVWRPCIMMPPDAAGWSEERRRIVLLHELAHVCRRETATHLLAHVAVILYWWNPLVWMALAAFLKESERAADDLVLNAGERATDYAGHLVAVARGMRGVQVMAWAAAPAVRESQLETRIRTILDSRVDRTVPRRAAVGIAGLLAAALVLPLAAVRAQQAQPAAIPPDIDAAIRVARSQHRFDQLEAAAQAAIRAAKYDEAHALLQAALAIRGETAGRQSVEYGVGLIQMAELEQKRNPGAEDELYAEALRILGGRREAARALTHIGLAALLKKDYPRAYETFSQAQAANPEQAALALMWMAAVRQREGLAEDAGNLYAQALAVHDQKPADQAVVMRVYSQFLRTQGRESEAAELVSRAKALQATDPGELPAGVYRVGQGVTPPKVESKIEPQYSDEARAALLQGTVVLRVVIGVDGRAGDAQIMRGVGLGLDENALQAVAQWRFKPGTAKGGAVPVGATIEVNFKLL